MDTASIRALFWWVGWCLIIGGAGTQWGWPTMLIGAGVAIAAYAALVPGRSR